MADARVRCPACGTPNRLVEAKRPPGARPLCGRCKAPLGDGKPLTVTDATFAADVAGSPLPVLLDAWAPWCAPCRMLAPVIDDLAREMAGRLRVVKLNVDENPATAARFALRSIPTLLVLRDGREIDRIVGAQPRTEIVRRVESLLG